MLETLDYLGKIYSILTDKWLNLKLLPISLIVDQIIQYYIVVIQKSELSAEDYKNKIRHFWKITAIKIMASMVILYFFFYGPFGGRRFEIIVLIYYIYVLALIILFFINITKRYVNFTRNRVGSDNQDTKDRQNNPDIKTYNAD